MCKLGLGSVGAQVLPLTGKDTETLNTLPSNFFPLSKQTESG